VLARLKPQELSLSHQVGGDCNCGVKRPPHERRFARQVHGCGRRRAREPRGEV